MKKFKCSYLSRRNKTINTNFYTKIEAKSPEDAALIYAQSYPSGHPKISVNWGLASCEVFPNYEYAEHRKQEAERRKQEAERKKREDAERKQKKEAAVLGYKQEAERKKREDAERKQKKEAARLRLLQKLHASVEDNEGDLSRLSYLEINALVENMQEFPGLAESLNPEEYAVREKLYKVAFFDRNLQAGLQAQYAEEQAKEATVQTELLNKLNIAVGNKPSGSVAKGSNAVKNAAMFGGAAALMKLNQISQDTAEISEDTSEISEGFEGFGGF